MKSLITVLLLLSTSIAQCAYSISILQKNGNKFEQVEYRNIRTHNFIKNKSSGKISQLTYKDNNSRDWTTVEIQGAWGYIVNGSSSNPKTYRFIKGKSHLLTEGDKNGDAIYYHYWSAYLIVAFLWKETYYLDYNGELIELKSKKQMAETLKGTCLENQLAKHKNRWVVWWTNREKKNGYKSALMGAVENCAQTGMSD